MEINEKLQVKEYEYPFADKINPLLYKIAQEIAPDHYINDERYVSGQSFVRWLKNDTILIKHKYLDLLIQWVSQLIQHDFHPDLECAELWGITYEKGMQLETHRHPSYVYSFSYYVNSPIGSPPLVFTTSRTKIKPKNGKLIIFDSRLDHHVPIGKVGDRCVIAGNFKLSEKVHYLY